MEIDQDAVTIARSLGLEVRCGSLEEQGYPAESFDAVTLCHVVEHLSDPRATIDECFRILKPSGRLVVATPNSDSLSRRLFGKDWRGLEPPRHLMVFSPRT